MIYCEYYVVRIKACLMSKYISIFKCIKLHESKSFCFKDFANKKMSFIYHLSSKKMFSKRKQVLTEMFMKRASFKECFSFYVSKSPPLSKKRKTLLRQVIPITFGVNRPDFFRRVDVWWGRSHLSPHKRAKGESDTGPKMNLKLLNYKL